MSLYIPVFLFAGLLVQSSLGFVSKGFKETVNGILYEYAGSTKSYWTAEKECHKNGGHLAKINLDLLDDKVSAPLYVFMTAIYLWKLRCNWIGMTDVAREGDWRWFDGTPVTAVKWSEEKTWTNLWAKPSEKDCGELCRFQRGWNRAYSWEWTSSKCVTSRSHSIICQYDVSNARQVTPKPLKKRNVQKPRERRPIVMVQTDEQFYITGLTPVVDKRVTMITMCARLCRGKCRYTNYNGRTGHCRGYADEKLTGKKDTNWQLWEPKQVSDDSP